MEHDSRSSLSRLAFPLLMAISSRVFFFILGWMVNLVFDAGRTMENLFCVWDCGWYLSIIMNGYDLNPSATPSVDTVALGFDLRYYPHPGSDAANWAFSPLFPLLAVGVSKITGLNALLSATLVANVSFIVAVPVLYLYCAERMSPGVSRWIVILLCFSPFSLYFTAPYTESTYLLLMAVSLYFAHSGKWLKAGLVAAALSATRNLGAFMVFPFLSIAASGNGWRQFFRMGQRAEEILLCLVFTPLGLFAYMYFLHQHVGDALAFAHVQIAWGRSIGNPANTLLAAIIEGPAYGRYCAIYAVLALLFAFYLFRSHYPAEGFILLFGTIIPMISGLDSMPRYTMTLFPVYCTVALIIRKYSAIRYPLLALMVLADGFMVWSWVLAKGYMI